MLRVLANREQSKANFVKIVESQTGCCGSDKTECHYTYADASLVEILSITIGGVVFALADTPEGQALSTKYEAMSSGAEKVKYTRQVILPFLFKEAGLVSDGISVTISANGQTITVDSEIEITLGSEAPSTTECVTIAYCDYCSNQDDLGDSFVVGIDGTDNTIDADTTGDFDYPGGEAEILAALETALTDAKEIVVMDDTVNSSYKIVLTYPEGTAVTIKGATIPCCSVEQGWTTE